jgi:hypothetical protein
MFAREPRRRHDSDQEICAARRRAQRPEQLLFFKELYVRFFKFWEDFFKIPNDPIWPVANPWRLRIVSTNSKDQIILLQFN